ncbi:restriction endonuclease subunit S [Bacteroides caecicola]|uniref:Restriction endonuclease subunit S n=1 Tax=Bacteroides caecicola TaxID=1462569 RepID=A0ABS2F8T0_9BACE|nr:restriction endonuclease subunit S [Bacteroides caecicola]MBM6806168.1 restriction endonuclease subunit S [Bacteroides caecicola]
MNKGEVKRLGDYIREVDVRNRDLEVTKLLGVSISKEFMPSIANTIGTDMSSYKVVEPRQFAYGPVTSRNGDKVSIALYKDDEKAIVSQAYTIFEVKNKQELLPEYLMMWFRRPEFDRYARFKSHGSAREIFSWEEMCDVELPIPPIEQQQKIVSEYEAVTRRIRLNEQIIAKLEETAQALYRKMFVDGIDKENLPEEWKMGTLEMLCELIIAGTIPVYSDESRYLVLGQKCNYNGSIDLSKARKHKPKSSCISLKFGDILINSTGKGTLGRVGQIYFQPKDVTFDSNMTMVRAKEDFLIEYVGSYVSQQENMFVHISQGSTDQTRLYCSMVRPLKIIIPDNDTLKAYSKNCRPIKLLIEQKRQENNQLKKLQSLFLAKMGQ